MPLPYKKIRRPERQRWLAFFAVLVLAFAAWLTFSPYGAVRYYRVHRDLRAATAENQRIRTENEQLAAENARLRSDRAYQKEVARRNFGMVGKNEMVFDFSSERKKGRDEE
ncbi:MAG: septum formation initiator family protein [Thermodesulfobacteriota bacterium]